VAELAVLPDSTSSRYTPNLKVYPANIHIDGTHDWLKPGMNAKVEIQVNELDDILVVPVQSIEVENDHYYTYMRNGSKLERREVKTGGFNDEFIEIKSGLNSGDQVALAIPKRSILDVPEPNPVGKKDKGAAKKGLAAR
jgi:multidrug efflux pump subunit AcrA (membrane-fusion protein)